MYPRSDRMLYRIDGQHQLVDEFTSKFSNLKMVNGEPIVECIYTKQGNEKEFIKFLN